MYKAFYSAQLIFFSLFSVKLWSLNENRSTHTIVAKANVCCVKFNPSSSHHLAFGSAGMYSQ